MKKLLLLLSLVSYFKQASAQVVFCPPGAEWRYIFEGFLYGNEYNRNIVYTRDSVVANETVKILRYANFYKLNSYSTCTPLLLIKQKGDTVFMQNCNTRGSWQILYNFATPTGQYWTTTLVDSANFGSHIPITHSVYVNAVSTVTINNMSLKKLNVSYCPSFLGSGCDSAEIIERIGCTTYLFNYYNHPAVTDYDVMINFLCYKDNSFGIKEYSSKGCSYVQGIAENKLSNVDVNIYPQPATDAVTLVIGNATGFKNYTVGITNLLGQTVLKPVGLLEYKTELDINTLPGGVYFLQLFDDHRLAATQKIIKE